MGVKDEKFNDYDGFVEKFKPKKTTDDCYTPPRIYNVIKEWACNEYGIDPDKVVMPFYPGGDYEHFDYSDGAVVVDNPPFSILAKIIDFYQERSIPFFLFAPSMTILSGRKSEKANAVVVDSKIIYENGATVPTSFITSFGEYAARTAPELERAIAEVAKELKTTKSMPKYEYPNEVLTSSMLKYMSKHGIDFRVKRSDCCRVRELDSQKAVKKGIYGTGFLLSEKAAAEKAAAEKDNAIVWELSDREREIIAGLGGN